MAKIRDYFYFDGVKKLYLETPKPYYDICPRCDGRGYMECDDHDEDCDELVWDCYRCGGMGEIERDWINKQEFREYYVDGEAELSEEIQWLLEMIETIDRQHKLIKRRYGKEVVDHLRDYWITALDNTPQEKGDQ